MHLSNLRILVTGANGFIGKNLLLRLSELPNIDVLTFVRGDNISCLPRLLAHADAIVHLAGVNRPLDDNLFSQVNHGLTLEICRALRNEFVASGRKLPLILASSSQVEQNNPYGQSKLAAEAAVEALAAEIGNSCVAFRLPGVFGKWCKPNYNSVVATFCHNLARELPIHINDPSRVVRLVYIDDVLDHICKSIENSSPGFRILSVAPEYTITLGDLASQIRSFADCRSSLMARHVGVGLPRALYATYVSYLPSDFFSYQIPKYGDARGVFVEMLKTPDSGQFSYFTAHPGVTRGGHYHHTKTEKFLVISGDALFRFRHILTNELFEIRTTGSVPTVVDTIPGWAHDISNIGSSEMLVLLWANEIFNRDMPDTIFNPIEK